MVLPRYLSGRTDFGHGYEMASRGWAAESRSEKPRIRIKSNRDIVAMGIDPKRVRSREGDEMSEGLTTQ